MTQFYLQNSQISLSVSNIGAEMNSLLFKNSEFLYQKTEGFWQRQSPVLFPIVGGLKNGEYQFRDEKFLLSQHGFARDMEFNCIFQNEQELHFLLKSTEQTKKMFPFDFELYIRYFLFEKSVKVEYEVKNTGTSHIFYSLGGHPAFKIGTDINKYSIKFEKNMENQTVDRIHPKEFLLDETYAEKFPFGDKKNILPLSEEYFSIDAMIFRNIISKKFDFLLANKKIFTFSFENFPHLGIWKQPNSPFICFEPWDGYVDMIDASGKIEEKAGIRNLPPQKNKKYSWTIVF